MTCLFRRRYAPAALLAAHPPRLSHPNKRLAFELACPPGAAHGGSIEVTRWAAAARPERLAPIAIEAVRGFYDYAGGGAGVWHVNFADPDLFGYYGGALLAQDELQCVEHPLLGPIREAMLAAGVPARTEDNAGAPTPVLVADVERRCAVVGIYGNAFGRATPDRVRAAIRVIDPPTRSNVIAIAAPAGGRGRYARATLDAIVATAYTAFAAAIAESGGAPVEICTGYWGCGAFGGDRRAMSALQIVAARLAGVARLRFHAADGGDEFERGAADVASAGDELEAVMASLDACAYAWGVGNGT